MAAKSNGDGKGGGGKNYLMLAGAAVLLGIAIFFADKQRLQAMTTGAIEYIQSQGNLGFLIYHLLLFAQIILVIPISPLEFAGGFLYKDTYGVPLVSFTVCMTKFAANLGSVFFARHFIRDWVKRNIVQKFELLQMVETAMADEPYKMSFLVRGAMIPLGVKNYGLGVMDVGYVPIIAGSLVFTPLYGFRNIYLGSSCSELSEIFAPKKDSGEATWGDIVRKMLPVVFNVLLVVFTIKVLMDQLKKQRAKIEKELRDKTDKEVKKSK